MFINPFFRDFLNVKIENLWPSSKRGCKKEIRYFIGHFIKDFTTKFHSLNLETVPWVRTHLSSLFFKVIRPIWLLLGDSAYCAGCLIIVRKYYGFRSWQNFNTIPTGAGRKIGNWRHKSVKPSYWSWKAGCNQEDYERICRVSTQSFDFHTRCCT